MDVVVSNVALSDEDVESNKKLVALLRRSVARRYPSTCRETWICLRSRRDAQTVFSPSRANATNPPVLKRWTSRSPASSPPSSSMPRSKLPRPVSYRRPKHLRRSTTMAESKTSPNNENIYATFTQHLHYFL